jgi:hypothetical protein
MLAGEKTAVAPVGKPVTASVKPVEKPVALRGVTVRLKTAGLPWSIVAELFDALRIKSGAAGLMV